jgi:hypothetical protein
MRDSPKPSPVDSIGRVGERLARKIRVRAILSRLSRDEAGQRDACDAGPASIITTTLGNSLSNASLVAGILGPATAKTPPHEIANVRAK